ncbi:MAG: cytidine deaminase [Bacteroidetes bacterium]|nr:cytidine deaminase [Bacteroidota bacterium]
MQKINLHISFLEYDSINDLTYDDRDLLLNAKEAVETAYAPYSQYHVGAAVVLSNGAVLRGSNQENAAYPSGLCAERVAVFAASAGHPDIPVKAIAITARAKHFTINTPVTPCGACRQVLAEYEKLHNHPIRIIMMGETGKILISESIGDLLPNMFSADELKK